MRLITISEPIVVRCPRCYDRIVLRHAAMPEVLDLAASMAGTVVDGGDPTGVQVALALHVRRCGLDSEEQDDETGQCQPEPA
jgi:hypothetical protein